MSFLSLNGTVIPVKSNAAGQGYDEHRLDRERMFDGALRMTRAGVFRKWPITTKLLTESDANAILALVNGGAILTASGDLVGGTDVAVMPIPGTADPVQTATGFRRRVSFEIREVGGPPPPDRTTVPFLFLQRGLGYWQDRDNSKTTPALDGDLVYTWEDQSGNGRDGQAYSGDFEGTDLRPKREGDQLHFGISAFSSHGESLIRFDSITGMNELHMMCGIRAAFDPPATTARATPFKFHGGGATSETCYPDDDGHLKINFAFDRAFDVGDLDADLTGLHVLSVSASNVTRQIIAKLDNVQILSYDLVGSESVGWAPGPGFPGSLQCIGFGAGDVWEGWFRDVFMTASVMTPSQERSWFDYIGGATDLPPLPI